MLPDKNDNKIVRNAMIVLFLSLVIVYVIRYQIQTKQISSLTTTTGSIADNLTITEKESTTGKIQTGQIITNPSFQEISKTGTTISQPPVPATKTVDVSEKGVTHVLSGTTLYFGPIEWIDKLAVIHKYALKDDKNIYFTSIGDKEPDRSAIARSLGGTLYTMNTETEITKNQLFGKRIVFINLPIYKDKLVLMYVEVGTEKWLLQISNTIYHTSKSYLQRLFTD